MTDENRDLLAHLFRRAGFGAKKADLDTYSSLGYNAAVDQLLKTTTSSNPTVSSAPLASSPTIQDLQTAWVKQMVTSKTPLIERMTLFLSDHFATSFTPGQHIDVKAMTAQQAKIRKYALGSFKDLVHTMIDDLALAAYLDNDNNIKTLPNENLGRELMELFILGAGNYSESDVKQAALALTGYEQKKDLTGNYTLVYTAARHDDSVKTILGTSAAFTPHSLVDLLLGQPAAKQFVATKLVAHFVSAKPDATLVSSVAASLARNWNLSDALRLMFTSSQFKSAAVRQAQVKTPAEYVVGAMRALGRTEYADGAAYVALAGQSLYRPPTVAGWPHGQRLLGAGSMLARYNAASKFASFHVSKPSASAPSGPELITWAEGFGMTSLLPTTTTALQDYANATVGQSDTTRVAGLITLLASSPDFNLA